MKRKDFGLADLFGVTFKGRVEGPMQNSYLRLETDPATGKRHPLLAGLEDAPRIINGVRRVEVEATRPFPNPPLDAHPVLSRSADGEGLSARVEDRRAAGLSRVSWVRAAWSISRGTSTARSGKCSRVDHVKLLRNAVDWATNEEPPVTVTGPGVLDVTVWRQKDSLTVHLVNLTNPMMMKGPVRELIPVGEQKVRLRLPEGAKPKQVRLLAADKSVRVVEHSGPVLERHRAVHPRP